MKRRYRLFYVPVSISITFLLINGQIRKYRRKFNDNDDDDDEIIFKPLPLEVSLYNLLPLRTVSRIWGWIHSIDLPESIRKPILKLYATVFDCNINEALVEDFSKYKNLNEFFRRELKPGIRPIEEYNDDDSIVSPCDGTILHFGSIKNDYLEQIKGIKFTIQSFLGPQTWLLNNNNNNNKSMNNENYQKNICKYSNSNLYYCIIYLAPGDYHRFHSPANWTISYRRHFPGKLYSVRPTFVSWFPNLFAINERIVYIGEWKYGFFSMIPIGAVNVGSMRVYFDSNLRTNQIKLSLNKYFVDKQLIHKLCKGDPFGEFNLGSTIVLIFESPKTLAFNIENGKKIKYGQLIGTIK